MPHSSADHKRLRPKNTAITPVMTVVAYVTIFQSAPKGDGAANREFVTHWVLGIEPNFANP